MKLLKVFLIIIFNFLIIIFLTQNSNQVINLKFLTFSHEDLNVNIAFLLILLTGLIGGYLSTIFIILSYKQKNKILNKENTKLSIELDELRNVTLDVDEESSND